MSHRTLSIKDQSTEFLLYTAPSGEVKVEVLLSDETLWLTQKRMSELFAVGVPAISKNLKNIFESGELDEQVVVSILENTTAHGAIEGKTQKNHHQILQPGCRNLRRVPCQFSSGYAV